MVAALTKGISLCHFSLKGRRDENQDACLVFYPDNQDTLTHKGVLACVADGVSCSQFSQRASQYATQYFCDQYYSTPLSWSVKHAANKLLTDINQYLFQEGSQQPSHNGLVTTFTAVIIKSTTAHIIHIGDSRVYLLRNEKIHCLTRDHCRTNFGQQHYLTRALGMDDNVHVDYQTLNLQVGDRFILSTDGVHGSLDDETLFSLIQNDDGTDLSLSEKICHNAYQSGSEDNATCVTLKINELSDPTLFEHQRKLLSKQIPPVLRAGLTLDHFTINKTLYEGVRSHVYMATDLRSQERRVIKVPSAHAQEEIETLKLFANEYWIAAQFDNPRVMKMYPAPDDSPFIYQVCEYIEGQTLRQWMYDNPNPSMDSVRTILHDIVKALRVFQRADMVHRDLKPENIMITADKDIKIIDFGAVKVSGLQESLNETEDSLPLGSVNYTAPEYINSGEATIFSDLFSIAVIGYEMLCSELPYKEQSQVSVQQARHNKWHYRSLQQYRDDIPLWIDVAFRKALSPTPKLRYQALGDFITDIKTPNQALLNNESNKPLLSRHPVIFWKSVALVACFIAVIEGLLLL